MSDAPLPPLTPRPEVLDFLATRRSRPVRTLAAPGPGRTELARLLAIATRVPDHGKLEPWRFVALSGGARDAFADALRARGAAMGREAADVEKAASAFVQAPLTVAVVFAPKASDKIPEWEQFLSAGAVCYGLLAAALAAGWGACWLTGWAARDRETLAALGCAGGETVAGFLHIGTETAPPPDRPRPDPAALLDWRG